MTLRKPIGTSLVCVVVLMSGLVLWRLAIASSGDQTPVEELDSIVLPRFRSVDTKFGLARIPRAHRLGSRFEPQTAREREVLDRLVADGWEVAFYLGGRRLLGSLPSEEEAKSIGTYNYDLHRTIDVPVSFTEPPDDLPSPLQLLGHGRKAMAAYFSTDTYRSSLGRWRVEAHPVRAHQGACLSCHNAQEKERPIVRDGKPIKPLTGGDAIGAVIYVYAKRHR